MRKIFTFMAALCCTMFSVMATELSDKAVITIGTTPITDENKANVLEGTANDALVSYDPESHTLSLSDGATLDAIFIDVHAAADLFGVTIEVAGSVSISSNGTPLQYIGYNYGYPLTITGDENANLSIMTYGSVDCAAILCAQSETSSSNSYTFKATGGMRISANNSWSGDFATIICHHVILDGVTMYLAGNAGGSEVIHSFDPISDVVEHTSACKYSEIDVTYYKYQNAYPVYINGFQLSDGKPSVNMSDMNAIKGGTASYDPETKTLQFSGAGGFELEASEEVPAIEISGTEKITIKGDANWESSITGPSSAPALQANTHVVINLNGANMSWSSHNAPAIKFSDVLEFITNNQTRTLTAQSQYDKGILGEGSDAKLVIDHCLLSAKGYFESFSGFELIPYGVALENASYTWNETEQSVMEGSNRVQNKWVDFKLTEWLLHANASPEAAGVITITDLSDAPLANPYIFSADEDVKLSVAANTGWDFMYWADKAMDPYDPDYASSPRTVSLTAGYEETYTAVFARRVATTETYYFVNSDLGVYKFNPVLRAADGGKIADLPVDLEDIEHAAFYDGKIYFIEKDYLGTKWSLVTVEFDGTTVGSPVKLFEDKNDYTFWRGFAFSENDGVFFAIAKKASEYKDYLLQVNPETGAITEVAVLSDSYNMMTRDIAIAADGTIYAISGSSPSTLCTVNPTTAEFTKVVDLSVDVPDWQYTATVIDASGEFYLHGGAPSQMLVVNTTNGKCDFVGETMVSTLGLFTITPAGTKYEIEVKVKAGQESRGSVSPAGKKNIAEGKTFAFSATPNKGFLFDQWEEDGNTTASRSITVTENATFTATFKEDPDMKIFPIKVGGVEMYSGAATIIAGNPEFPALKAGAISYDANTKTLTLSAAEITVTGSTVALEIGGDVSGELTIVVVGTCAITAAADAIDIADFNNVVFKGEGLGAKLTINSGSNAVSLDGSNLAINGLETVIVATGSGIIGTDAEVLTVDGSYLQVKGNAGSITGLDDLERLHCALASGYDFVKDDHCVKKSGVIATDNVVFNPWKSITVTPVEKGSGHFTLTGDVNNETFEDKGFFEENENVTITAVPEDGFVFGHWSDDANWKDAEQRWGAERPDAYKMTASDKAFSALFYFSPSTTSTWYGINNNKVVSFSFDDNCEEGVNPKKALTVSSVKAGDFVEGSWYVLDGTNLKSWAFEGGFDKDTELETETEIVAKSAPSGVTDIAYDLMAGEAFAVAGKKLYFVNTSDTKFEEIGTFKYKDIERTITCIAIDGSGTKYVLGAGDPGVLYTVSEIDEEGKIVKLALVGEEKDGGSVEAAVSTDAQSMSFDHVTGDLIWGAPDYVRVISTENAKSHIAGDLGQKAGAQGVIKGLHKMDVTVNVVVDVAEDCKGMGTVSIGTGSKTKVAFIEGTPATIVATPNAGHKFVKWVIMSGKTEKDFKNNDQASLTVTAGNNKYIAYFEESDEGFDNIQVTNEVRKVMIDGTIYIVRENGIFTITGARVK